MAGSATPRRGWIVTWVPDEGARHQLERGSSGAQSHRPFGTDDIGVVQGGPYECRRP